MLAAGLLVLNSCSKPDVSSPAIGKVEALALPIAGWTGDESYAKVKSAALFELHERFTETTFKLGLPARWDRKFDCNRFAGLWIGVAQVRYAAEQWHSKTAPQALALAEVWYYPDYAPAGVGHAIVAAVTEVGLLFFEPQTGSIITLSAAERSKIYFVRW